MMTKEKAFAFLSGFDQRTRERWFSEMLAWRWPDDLPFFANPLPTVTPLLGDDRIRVLSDPTWKSFRDALYASLPRTVTDKLILTHYSIDLSGYADALQRNAMTVEAAHYALIDFRDAFGALFVKDSHA